MANVRESFSTEGGVVSKGPLESKAKATTLLEKFRLPPGLFPLTRIEEFGFNETSGLMWMKQPARTQKEFPDFGIVAHYDKAIHGYVESHKIKKLVGFKLKEIKEKDLFISVPYNEVEVENDVVVLRSDRDHPRAFPVSLFTHVV